MSRAVGRGTLQLKIEIQIDRECSNDIDEITTIVGVKFRILLSPTSFVSLARREKNSAK